MKYKVKLHKRVEKFLESHPKVADKFDKKITEIRYNPTKESASVKTIY